MPPELREYKQQTCNQLLTTLPQLEEDFAMETDPRAARQLGKQVEAVRHHIQRLQLELAHDTVLEPVADELYRLTAQALVKEKFYLAQKRLTELETIEPFYPSLNRLREEVMTGKVSRNTRAIAEGTAAPFVLSAAHVPSPLTTGLTSPPLVDEEDYFEPEEYYVEKSSWWSSLFQFHIVASCLVILFIFCTMAAVGGTALLEYLIEGL